MSKESDIRRPRRQRQRAIEPATLSPPVLPRPALTVTVESEGRRWTCLGALDPGTVAGDVAAALARHRKLSARVGVTLMLSTDARVRILNLQYRGIDKPTNVLSFPSVALPLRTRDAEPQHLGDLIVARETLFREAADLRVSPSDHFRHLVLHGLLHLLGFDHETDEDAEEMETLETRILATLGVADPYAGTEPVAQGARDLARRRQPTRAR